MEFAMDWDWPMFRRVERQAKRFVEMMQRLDVDTSKLVRIRDGAAYKEARDKCRDCHRTHECLIWLDADPPSLASPKFCPNFRLFEKCKKRQDWPLKHDQVRGCADRRGADQLKD
jgi:hypothetical protein